MDRFIVKAVTILYLVLQDLKSNMDRFIVTDIPFCSRDFLNLKSNMDRFIAPVSVSVLSLTSEFKIQYG